MPFMLRDVLRYSRNLDQVSDRIQHAKGTNSYLFLMSDGKAKQARMFVKDARRFLSFLPGTEVQDEKEHLLRSTTRYGGRYNDKMTENLQRYHGQLTPKLFMETLIPEFAMPSNFFRT